MANESTTALWAAQNSLSVIVRARLLMYAMRQVILGNLFTVDDTSSSRGLVHGVSRWPDLSGNVSDITEGTDLANVAVTATTVQITPATVGMLAEIHDLLGATTPFAGLDPFIAQMAGAVGEELDDDVGALFTALNSGTAVGTTTVDLSLADFIDGLVTVQAAQAPAPYFAALHPRQVGDLAIHVGGFSTTTHVTPTLAANSPGAGGAAGTISAAFLDKVGTQQAGFVGEVAGTPIFSSPRCPLVNASADRSGCIASADAITIARKWSLRPEQDRNIAGPATLLAVTSAYGVAETADNFGVPVETDA